MTEHKASRTLVKSPPELWAELSDQPSLATHLAEPFGEIRITRLEPETAVAWEGERASGTVRIEPSGWGTRVTLTARADEAPRFSPEELPDPAPPAPAPLPRPSPMPEDPLPPAAVEPSGASESVAPRQGLLGRLLGWLGGRRGPAPASDPPPGDPPPGDPPLGDPPPHPSAATETHSEIEPTPASAPVRAPAPATLTAPTVDPEVALVGVLDRLGAAHHRPFSRS